MKPFYADTSLTVYVGDCRAVIAEMEPESIHCVVTSPPYWGLRDYGVSGQLGLEPTPEAYVAAMVAVFREVKRVLRDDGTVWLNLGDSYAGSGKRGNPADSPWSGFIGSAGRENAAKAAPPIIPFGLKPKDLVGIPWRVAFALQADGWYLRSDIIWSKPNPMPESVTDRPTKAHEYVFLLSKSPRYYFDADAVREADVGSDHDRRTLRGQASLEPSGGLREPHGGIRREENRNGTGRNIRSVWTIATQPYPGAHFATFPEKLVEPCIKAGTSERGVCPECGAPWVREVERRELELVGTNRRSERGKHEAGDAAAAKYYGEGAMVPGGIRPSITTGWRPSCAHAAEPVPATCLDPFAGSGTVGRVANRLGRRAVLIDLSADYIDQAMLRNAQAPLGLGA